MRARDKQENSLRRSVAEVAGRSVNPLMPPPAVIFWALPSNFSRSPTTCTHNLVSKCSKSSLWYLISSKIPYASIADKCSSISQSSKSRPCSSLGNFVSTSPSQQLPRLLNSLRLNAQLVYTYDRTVMYLRVSLCSLEIPTSQRSHPLALHLHPPGRGGVRAQSSSISSS